MVRAGRSGRARRVAFDVPAIEREIDSIRRRALHGEIRVVTLGPLVFFSAGSGDAWMFDPSDGRATCLQRGGSPLPVRVEDRGAQVAVEWAGSYRIDGEAFAFADPVSGVVTVLGYPTREIEAAAARLAG